MNWISRLWARAFERAFGYVPVGRWRLYRLEEKHRRRYSMPERVPIPAEEYREWPPGYRPEKLSHSKIASHAARFSEERPRHWAARELRRFADKAPLAEKIEDALRHREWDRATGWLREVLRHDPDDARAHFLLALALLGQQHTEEAAVHLAQAAETMAIDADYQFAVGRMHEQQGDLDAARAHYRRAIEIERGHPSALERLAAHGEMVEIFLGEIEAPEKAYLSAQDYEEVIVRGWNEAVRDAGFFLARARSHLMNGQPAIARKAAEFALANSQSTADEVAAHELRCRACLACGDNEAAKESVARLEAAVPGTAAELSCRGQWLWFEGRREEAAEVITAALRLDPDRVENLRIFLDPGFPRPVREPVAAARELLKEQPQSWAVQFVIASLLMAKESWDESVGYAFAAAKLGATEEALIELSGRLGRARRYDDVYELIERAGGWKRFADSNPLLRANIATALEQSHRQTSACELWRGLYNDDAAHPDLRLRAREALRRCSPEARTEPPVH